MNVWALHEFFFKHLFGPLFVLIALAATISGIVSCKIWYDQEQAGECRWITRNGSVERFCGAIPVDVVD